MFLKRPQEKIFDFLDVLLYTFVALHPEEKGKKLDPSP